MDFDRGIQNLSRRGIERSIDQHVPRWSKLESGAEFERNPGRGTKAAHFLNTPMLRKYEKNDLRYAVVPAVPV